MKRTIVILAVAAASMVAIAQPPSNSNPTPRSAPAPASSSAPAPAPASSTPVPAPALTAVSSQATPAVQKERAQIPKSVVLPPLSTVGQPVIKPKYERVDGMSSRPWEQIVGIHPGYTAFPAPEKHEPGIYLFWIGRDPYSAPYTR